MASSALAAPSDPTLGLTALQSRIATAPDIGLDGYFKTVDKGSKIETIPVHITAVTGGPLIVFDAYGPQIDKFGGIVSGMSGSPVYVNDGGVDKVVGAVSYGDYFTKGGMGLATPIEDMLLIQSTYAPQFINLAKPLITSAGPVKSVILAPDPQDYSVQSKLGAFVASPLASTFIGGLDPASPGYKLLAKDLAAQGRSVVSLVAPLAGSPTGDDQSFETTLVPGAAVAAMEARGDMWIGGIGTVTYTDTDTVLAFGHPAFWAGPSSLFMTNAFIDGVWNSTYEPYKLGRPTALQGTITQDRHAGIMGQIGQMPAETVFTAHAYDVDRNVSASSTVYMSQQLLGNSNGDPGFAPGIDPITAALGLYSAGGDLLDAQQTPGSADVTTTVVATDGDATYTVSIPNRVDTGYDVPLAAVQDAATAVSTLQQIPADGVHKCRIVSVDLSSRFSRKRDWAQILGVKLPNGLKSGANSVQVSARMYGVAATQTINATLTVPAGVRTSGVVYAVSEAMLSQYSSFNSNGGIGYSTGFFDPGINISIPSTPGHASLAEAVTGLNSALPNSAIALMFIPNSADGSGLDSPFALTSASIAATVPTDWVFGGGAAISVTQLTVSAHPSLVPYGGETFLDGMLVGPSSAATVAVYATPAGGTEQYVGTFDADGGDSGFEFMAPVGPLTSNTTIRVHYEGTSGSSSADAITSVRVRGRAVLRSSAATIKSGRTVTLKASVYPAASSGSRVAFEYNDRGSHWRTISTKTLTAGTSSATASATWKALKGKHRLRVSYLGGTSNAASTSGVITVTGK